jgi:hypothetical protein
VPKKQILKEAETNPSIMDGLFSALQFAQDDGHEQAITQLQVRIDVAAPSKKSPSTKAPPRAGSCQRYDTGENIRIALEIPGSQNFGRHQTGYNSRLRHDIP